MAHFAQLDSNNLVTRVIVVDNDKIRDGYGNESEEVGIAFCKSLLGDDTNWKQTSYNNNFRGNYAGIGMTYMSGVKTLGVASTDVFIELSDHASWSIGIKTAAYYPPEGYEIPPVLTPSEQSAGKVYVWNESNYQSNPSTGWELINCRTTEN